MRTPEQKAYARKISRKYRERHPGAHRKAHRLSRYGLTAAAFAERAQVQKNRCKICGATSAQNANREWCVDHDHQTGRVRGLLCLHCNSLLGMAHDQISVLENAIKYLKGEL